MRRPSAGPEMSTLKIPENIPIGVINVTLEHQGWLTSCFLQFCPTNVSHNYGATCWQQRAPSDFGPKTFGVIRQTCPPEEAGDICGTKVPKMCLAAVTHHRLLGPPFSSNQRHVSLSLRLLVKFFSAAPNSAPSTELAAVWPGLGKCPSWIVVHHIVFFSE